MTEALFATMPEEMKLILFQDLDLLDVLCWSITCKRIMNAMNSSHWWIRLLKDEAQLSVNTIVIIEDTYIRQYKGWVYVMGAFYDYTRHLDPFASHFFCPFCIKQLQLQPICRESYLKKGTKEITINCPTCTCTLNCSFARTCVSCEWNPGISQCDCKRALCESCKQNGPCTYCSKVCHICHNRLRPGTMCRFCGIESYPASTLLW